MIGLSTVRCCFRCAPDWSVWGWAAGVAGQVLACLPADVLSFVVRFAGRGFSALHPGRRRAGNAGRAGTSAVAPRNLNCVSSPALQQPRWPGRGPLEAVVRRLEGLPPLVLAAECDQLKERLAPVARGEAFLLTAVITRRRSPARLPARPGQVPDAAADGRRAGRTTHNPAGILSRRYQTLREPGGTAPAVTQRGHPS